MSQCMPVNSRITWEERNQSVLCVNLSKKSVLYVCPKFEIEEVVKNLVKTPLQPAVYLSIRTAAPPFVRAAPMCS